MLRVRFKTNGEDYRPVYWPIKYPFWCTGYAGDGSYTILVAYVDSEQALMDLWPEAYDLDIEEVDSYTFTDRFKKPGWFEG